MSDISQDDKRNIFSADDKNHYSHSDIVCSLCFQGMCVAHDIEATFLFDGPTYPALKNESQEHFDIAVDASEKIVSEKFMVTDLPPSTASGAPIHSHATGTHVDQLFLRFHLQTCHVYALVAGETLSLQFRM